MKYAVPVVLAIGLSVGGAFLLGGDDEPAAEAEVDAGPQPEEAPEPEGNDFPWRESTDYAEALAALDAAIEYAEARVERQPRSWMPLEALASSLNARATLTGSFDDYEAALEALERAFEIAPEGGGPHLTNASIAFSVHRLEEALASATAARGAFASGAQTLEEITGIEGDVALHRMDFETAAEKYGESERINPLPGSAFRRGQYLWQTGEWEQADELFVEAKERLVGDKKQIEAYFELQRGILDLGAGRYDEAMAHYEAADTIFGGWWLVHEHMAEILLLRAEHDAALTAYRDVVERTGSPELMGALADTLEEMGQDEEAAQWRGRAEETYEAQLEQLPEAAYGHALDHFLGTDVERGLELARQNAELRPSGDARTTLAHALALNGQMDEAREALAPVLESPYRSPATHVLASVLFELGGDEDAAAEQARLAGELSEVAESEITGLREELE